MIRMVNLKNQYSDFKRLHCIFKTQKNNKLMKIYYVAILNYNSWNFIFRLPVIVCQHPVILLNKLLPVQF